MELLKVCVYVRHTQTTTHMHTTHHTPIEPGDYTTLTTTLTFAPGETGQPVPVSTIDDSDVENAETFGAVLSNPANAELGVDTATVQIDDNDGTNRYCCVVLGIGNRSFIYKT